MPMGRCLSRFRSNWRTWIRFRMKSRCGRWSRINNNSRFRERISQRIAFRRKTWRNLWCRLMQQSLVVMAKVLLSLTRTLKSYSAKSWEDNNWWCGMIRTIKNLRRLLVLVECCHNKLNHRQTFTRFYPMIKWKCQTAKSPHNSLKWVLTNTLENTFDPSSKLPSTNPSMPKHKISLHFITFSHYLADNHSNNKSAAARMGFKKWRAT